MIVGRWGGSAAPLPFQPIEPGLLSLSKARWAFVFLETRHDRLVRPLRLRSRGQAALPHCRTRAFTPAGDNAALSTRIFRSPLEPRRDRRLGRDHAPPR